MRPAATRLVLALVVLSGATGAGAGGAGAQAAEPTVIVSPASAEPGGRVQVWLDNWPVGVVTVQVCGNAARRGSQDCDNVGAHAVPIRDGRGVQFILGLTTPPVGCPCVVRATTTASDVVRAAPIDLIGVPGGVQLDPSVGTGDASQVSVGAKVVDHELEWPKSWYAKFGADAQKDLVLTITNGTSAPIDGLRVTGQVGRTRGSGEPLAQPVEGAILPGEQRKVVVPFDISAPAWGHYVVSGNVYGLSDPLAFRTNAENDPWGLEVAVILFVIVLALLARRRERREREGPVTNYLWVPAAPPMATSAPLAGPATNGGAPAPAPARPLVTEPVVVLPDELSARAPSDPVPESSPDVGSAYEERYGTDFYDQARDDAHPGPNGTSMPGAVTNASSVPTNGVGRATVRH
jgi:hypothetical protein